MSLNCTFIVSSLTVPDCSVVTLSVSFSSVFLALFDFVCTTSVTEGEVAGVKLV